MGFTVPTYCRVKFWQCRGRGIDHALVWLSFHFVTCRPQGVDSAPWCSRSSPSCWPSAPASTTSGSLASSAPSSFPSSWSARCSRPRSCPAKTTSRGRPSQSPQRLVIFQDNLARSVTVIIKMSKTKTIPLNEWVLSCESYYKSSLFNRCWCKQQN